LHFSAKGELLFGSAGRPVAWDTRTGRESAEVHWLGTRSWRNLLSPDGSVVANIALDDTLALFATSTGKPLHTLGRSKSFGWGMAFSPDGRRLYTTTIGQAIDEWDVATGRRLRALDTMGKDILWLTTSPNGRWLASATGVRGDREITLWDLTTGRERATYKLRAGSFFAFAFSPDSRFLATVESGASGLGEVKLWDIAIGTVWRSIVMTSKKPSPAVAFSPDGRMLATGGEDGSLLLWELASGRIRERFVGHQDWIGSLAFSPNGRYLAAASTDAPVFLWAVMDESARPTALSPAVLEQAWTTLAGDDAAAAWQAVKMLAAAPARSVPFLQKSLHPAARANQKQLEQLIARLDSPRFAVRQHATTELAQWLEQAEPLLRKALTSQLSAETRRRIEQLLQGLDPATGERLRQLRAVEVLEYAATPEVRSLLAELAQGVPEAGVTRAAKAALQRLVRLPMKRLPKAGAAPPREN
ncbi:MAG TPA: WD40 repeat domain-containing protein, partial [Gemmataceae bacterium]|nr:WD40 repeat domain-containing protein [Gemmataceae bacterium]